MIGIDLTDLSDPLLKSRENALRLISHPEDQPGPTNNSFWQLWCSKEAVFKAERKKIPFVPKEIPIQFLSEEKFQSKDLFGAIEESKEFTLSIAFSSEGFDYAIFNRTTGDSSTEIRRLITQWFKRNHQVDTIVLNDTQGLPILSHNHSPISITHHGRFMAFAYLPK